MKPSLVAVLALFTCALPAQQPAQQEEREFPKDWYWHSRPGQWEKHAPLLGKPLPKLDLGEWRNGNAKLLARTKGKVVVLDFWATWCGPCIASIPHNQELIDKYGKQGLVFVAICGSDRGQEDTDKVIAKHEIRYPVARDLELKSAKALAVQWWPTYVAIDRAGKVRAIGLKPGRVDEVVAKLLAEKPGKGAEAEAGAEQDGEAEAEAVEAEQRPAAAVEIPAAWLEHNDKRDALTGKPAPALQVTTWANGDAKGLGDFAGKIVLLDFWATWCGPCIASIPHTNELQKKYGRDGLVVLGICHPRGGEKMADTVKQKGIEYLTALDESGATIAAYGVNGFPDYYFIDRKGVLRIADCSNRSVEDAIKALLSEK